MECFVEHSGLFGKWLVRDYLKWYAVLKDFAEFKREEDYKIGLKALDTLLEQSALQLSQMTTEETKARKAVLISVRHTSSIIFAQAQFIYLKNLFFFLSLVYCGRSKKNSGKGRC